MDHYKNVIEQTDIERKKLREEKATQELINLKMAEEMAALQKQQPDTNTLREHFKKELVADYNTRLQILKEEEEWKRQSLIATITSEFDTKAERFQEEQTLKHRSLHNSRVINSNTSLNIINNWRRLLLM